MQKNSLLTDRNIETKHSERTTTIVKLRKKANTAITFIAAYFKDSSIHGLQYVVKKDLTTIEKCFWLTLLLVSMFFCMQIGLVSKEHYDTKSTVVGLERNFYYWNTTLPSATICPLKRLDENLFTQYCRQHNLSPAEQQQFYEFLEKLANSTYINLLDIPDNKSIDLILDRLNITPNKYMQLIYNVTVDTTLKYKIDLNDVTYSIRSDSGDIIIETRQILTEYGLCYMTNTMLSPKYTSSYMIWGILPKNEITDNKTILQLKKCSYFDSDVSYNFLGFNNSPLDSFLHSSYEVMRLDHNLGYTDISLQVDVDSIEIISEEGLDRITTVSQRKCRFQHESNLTHFEIYTRTICQQECRLNLVYKMCKCIPHFYPNRITNPKTVCSYKTLRECVAQHQHLFIKLYTVDSKGQKQILPCYCEQNCQDAIINKRAKFVLQKAASLVGGNSILFTIINLPTYRLKHLLIYSYTDLLVSLGGNAGLFLGFSVLCFVEFIYYFTLRLFFCLIKAYFQKD